MSQKTEAVVASIIGIDTGKNTLHLIGLDDEETIVLREKLGRSRIGTRLANVPRCLIGIEAGMATHRVARELIALGTCATAIWRLRGAGLMACSDKDAAFFRTDRPYGRSNGAGQSPER